MGGAPPAEQKMLLATHSHPPPPSALPLLTWASKIELLSNRMTDSSLCCVLVPEPLVLPSCVADRSAATMPRALISSGSTTASHTSTLQLRRRVPPGCHPCRYSRRLAPYPIRVSVSSQYMIAPSTAPPYGMLLQLSSIVQISPAYLDFPLFYLSKLLAPPCTEPGIRAFALLPISSYLPRPPTSPASQSSAVARCLATVIVHVGAMPQVVPGLVSVPKFAKCSSLLSLLVSAAQGTTFVQPISSF